MKKLILGLGIALLVTVAGALLGGSAIWLLGGAHSLDIEGRAVVTDTVAEPPSNGGSWTAYGGDDGGNRYSTLTQITADNLDQLQPAWRFSTGDMATRGTAMRRAPAQATPILVDDALVFCTPFNEIIALDPGSGELRWRYDAEVEPALDPANAFVCRGVTQWRAPADTEDCPHRVFMGTNDARLIAVDARSGVPCASFGDGGSVTIDPEMALLWPGEFQITSPPVVVDGSVIVGSSISDNARRIAPAGSVRAYDALTGAPRWTFDPIPRDGALPDDWQGTSPPPEGHANVWAPMSVDPTRGLVFLPTSSASPDFYGGLRPGDNRYANSVVALRGADGALAWSFQTVHHDVWDYDLPAQPGLYSVWRDGARHEVVAQVTKTGLVFVLDRDSGSPFLPVKELPVPQGGVAGEVLSPTQPMPASTPPLVPHALDADDAFGLTWFDRRACRKRIEASRFEGVFTPPSTQGTLIYPFNGGGANWGSAAFDPARNLLVINMSNLAHDVQLIPNDDFERMQKVHHDQEVVPQTGTPFGMKREVLLSPIGLPCTPPPWGIIAGVDLADGRIVWRRALGTTEDLADGPALELGTPNFGGPIITASGLVFIGAALDDYLRAFSVETGEELWRHRLPGGGQATPMTYEYDGRQFVVIYAGGNPRAGTTQSDLVVAFALPAPDPTR